jgi:hypothetical protein
VAAHQRSQDLLYLAFPGRYNVDRLGLQTIVVHDDDVCSIERGDRSDVRLEHQLRETFNQAGRSTLGEKYESRVSM